MALGAMAQDNDDPDITNSLPEAVRLRSDYLRGQADHLTLPAVRRLLERDLGLRASQLDVHKALIKRLVDKVLNEGEDEITVAEKPRKRRKNTARVVDDEGEPETDRPHDENVEKKRRLFPDSKVVREKGTSTDEDALKNVDVLKPQIIKSEDEMKVEDGSKLESGVENPNEYCQPDDVKVSQPEAIIISQPEVMNVDENAIKTALMKRADEMKSQAESITVTNVRRLLETDLGLEPNKLDKHKLFIRTLVYEILASANGEAGKGIAEKEEVADGEVSKKAGKGKLNKKKAFNIESDEHGDPNSVDSDSDETKQRKNSRKKANSAKKRNAEVKKVAEAKKPFGPNVERLRAIFKTIGLGIPPSAYSKAKQATEDERDEVLVKELENLLKREGCPPNPSAYDIKKVKAQLTKKRDLDGIDNTNIVSEPRRSRVSANSWFTPNPNRYLPDEKTKERKSDAQDSDGDGKPKVTGRMDD